jgi:PhoH-like ATPase
LSEKKIFVIDTNVVLHDPNFLYKFLENWVYLPLAVIDDLDNLKTRKESVGWSAREAFRTLEKFNIKDMTNGGAILNDEGGRLFIYNPETHNKTDIPDIKIVNSDNEIIKACLNLKKENPETDCVIVSKDVGLRIRAQSYGCIAQNYRADLLEEENYTGIRYVDINNNEDWEMLWGTTEIKIESLSDTIKDSMKNHLNANEYIIFCWGERQCPTKYLDGKLFILKDKNNGDNKKSVYLGIKANNIEQICAMNSLADRSVSLVSLYGSAGTGKTICAVAVSLQQVFDGFYDRLIIIKPIIPFGGRDLGALPGDKWEKLYEWFGPFKDNIEQLVLSGKSDKSILSLEDLVKDGKVEAEAMAYIQGRSIPNSIIILDEAENISPREARMVVERCGKNSKIILLGDLSQIENPYLDSRSCGLTHAIQGSKNFPNAAAIKLSKVERSELSALASEIFNQPEARR